MRSNKTEESTSTRLMRLLAVATIVASANAWAPSDATYRGAYECGPNAAPQARATQAFSAPIELEVRGESISGDCGDRWHGAN